jgi:hypothetical protein
MPDFKDVDMLRAAQGYDSPPPYDLVEKGGSVTVAPTSFRFSPPDETATQTGARHVRGATGRTASAPRAASASCRSRGDGTATEP